MNTLDIWPVLPLVVRSGDNTGISSLADMDNIIAALGQSNRVCRVDLKLGGWLLEEVLAPMQVPFPELTDLQLWIYGSIVTTSIIPDSFLGGSAPHLRYFKLHGIPFPGLPKLLLTATHLVSLRLCNIPDSGYISPEAMVALLSVLSSLRTLILQFQSLQSRPDGESQNPHPLKRSILPSLDKFHFTGGTEYLEDLVTHIDTPQLHFIGMILFNQIGSPRIAQFINRTLPRTVDEALVSFNVLSTSVMLLPGLLISIPCREPDRQLFLSVAQVCNPLEFLSTAKVLYIGSRDSQPVWNDDEIEDTLWLQLLLPYTAVKDLYLSKVFAPSIAAALKELVGGRIIEMLPSLQNIFVEELESSGPFQENIGQFVAARQLSVHPIAISNWEKWMSCSP